MYILPNKIKIKIEFFKVIFILISIIFIIIPVIIEEKMNSTISTEK